MLRTHTCGELRLSAGYKELVIREVFYGLTYEIATESRN
jgi:hypothetical protein